MLTLRRSGDEERVTYTLSGRLDFGDVSRLEEELQRTVRRARVLVFDLRELRYICTGGVRVLLAARRQMERQGRLQLLGVGDAVRQKLEIKGLADVFGLPEREDYAGEDAAAPPIPFEQ